MYPYFFVLFLNVHRIVSCVPKFVWITRNCFSTSARDVFYFMLSFKKVIVHYDEPHGDKQQCSIHPHTCVHFRNFSIRSTHIYHSRSCNNSHLFFLNRLTSFPVPTKHLTFTVYVSDKCSHSSGVGILRDCRASPVAVGIYKTTTDVYNRQPTCRWTWLVWLTTYSHYTSS